MRYLALTLTLTPQFVIALTGRRGRTDARVENGYPMARAGMGDYLGTYAGDGFWPYALTGALERVESAVGK